jgi:hypothetical protein
MSAWLYYEQQLFARRRAGHYRELEDCGYWTVASFMAVNCFSTLFGSFSAIMMMSTAYLPREGERLASQT